MVAESEIVMGVIVRFLSRVGRHPLPVVLIAGMLAAVLLVAAMPVSGIAGARSPIGVMAGLVVLAMIVAVVQVARLLAGVDHDAPLIARGLVDDDTQQRLLTRWLERTRWARNVGGVAGLVWWLMGTSAQGDLLLHGVGGLAIGSALAQLHFVRRVDGQRTAALDARSVGRYLPRPWAARMLAGGAGGAILVGTAVALGRADAAGFGLAAVGVLAVAHLTQRRVATRPRPALPETLRSADDLVRELAIDRGLAQPSVYVALALLAHGVSELGDDLGFAATLLAVAAWTYALRLWWQNRRLGLDWVMAPATTVGAGV